MMKLMFKRLHSFYSLGKLQNNLKLQDQGLEKNQDALREIKNNHDRLYKNYIAKDSIYNE